MFHSDSPCHTLGLCRSGVQHFRDAAISKYTVKTYPNMGQDESGSNM